MGVLGTIVGLLSVGFFILMVGMQVMLRRRSAAMRGVTVPSLPGALGQRVGKSKHALVYFFSQSCGACRSITPRVQALKSDGVFLVDVGRELELARALNVMATPSTIEITNGTITGYHVGLIPEAVLERFRAPVPT